MQAPTKILIAVLNWGLGHATRCIPIIDEYRKQRVEVLLASDGEALALLQDHYPTIPTIELPSYAIHYKGNNMLRNIAPQIPKILNAIRLERKKLNSIIQEHKITTIISDNRYGMYHKQVHSIFLTHQLNIKVPYEWLEHLVASGNHYFIRKFDECWVPDLALEPSLAGALSHQTNLKNIRYIGALSRMQPQKRLPQKWDVIAVLSGPEPQRTYWEQALLKQAEQLPCQFLIVAGKPKSNRPAYVQQNITWKPFLRQEALQMAIAQSEMVIARSGYSTIMDLVALNCHKVLLVPTPGQTEQEYLARRFAQKGIFAYQEQVQLDLQAGIKALKSQTTSNPFPVSKSRLEKIVAQTIKRK